MEKLMVSFDEFQTQLNLMDDLCEEYRSLYHLLFTKIDESALYWKGKDQEAFVSKIHESEADFDRMFDYIRQYVEFLEKSLDAYRICQDEIQERAMRM